MVDLIGIEPTTLRMRTVRSPSWAIGPYCRFLTVFQNKKRSFKVFSFREFRRNYSPKSWASYRWWMCVHMDANVVRSQLRYRPVWWMLCRPCSALRNICQLCYYTKSFLKCKGVIWNFNRPGGPGLCRPESVRAFQPPGQPVLWNCSEKLPVAIGKFREKCHKMKNVKNIDI